MEFDRRRRAIGNGAALRLLAVGHAVTGAVLYRNALRSIARDGVVGTVPYRGPKATAFWFIMPSATTWLVGRLVSRAEEAQDEEALRAAGRIGVVTAAVGTACMPVSGFPLLFLVALRSLRQTRKSRSAHS